MDVWWTGGVRATRHERSSTINDDREPDRHLTVAEFTDAYGPRASGVVHAVQVLEGRVLAAGHRVVLVAPASAGTNPYAGHANRREVRLPSVQVPGAQLRMSLGKGFEEALEQLVADPPDVVHVHGLGPVGLLGMWVADLAQRPSVVTWHTDFEAYADYYGPLIPLLDAAYQVFLRRYAPHRRQVEASDGPGRVRTRLTALAASMLTEADVVTTPTERSADRVRELAPRARVRVVPNGSDPLPTLPPIPRGQGPRLLYVGWLGADKGIPLLLDAFERVFHQLPEAELMLIGPHNTGDLVLRRKLAQGTREGWLSLPGEIPQDQLGAYYAAADAFVYPSTTDTQALVLHEAAHTGLPLVLVDPCLDLVAEDGVNAVFAAPTPTALAQAILGLVASLKDPAFAARARARSRELAARWTVLGQTGEVISLYEEVAAQARAADLP